MGQRSLRKLLVGAGFDEPAQTLAEALELREVHEVSGPGPLLDLDSGDQCGHVLALGLLEPATEHGEVRAGDPACHFVDPLLHVLGIGSQHLVPVAEDELRPDTLAGEHP